MGGEEHGLSRPKLWSDPDLHSITSLPSYRGLLLLLPATSSFIEEGSVSPAGSPQMHTTTYNTNIRAYGGMTSGDTMDISIIGGGVSGLSVLQAIMGNSQHKSGRWKPTVSEARGKTGEVW